MSSEIKKLDRLVYSVELRDVFVREGKRSFTLGLEFRDDTKTLESRDVEKLRSKLEKTLSKKFQAKVRKD